MIWNSWRREFVFLAMLGAGMGAASAQSAEPVRTVHVFVALADNLHQGPGSSETWKWGRSRAKPLLGVCLRRENVFQPKQRLVTPSMCTRTEA